MNKNEPSNSRFKGLISITYGIGFCAIIGIAAKFLSAFLPLGSVAIAILLGILVGNSMKPGGNLAPGIAFSEKHILAAAIALMGVNLNYLILKELGYQSLILIVAAIGMTVLTAIIIGRIFRINPKLALLLGIGSGVCGTSAIVATEGIIDADKEDVGLSIAIVNFLGSIGMFLLPVLGTVFLKFSDVSAGLLIGNTLQAIGQATAGGFSISDVSGQTATIVKMGRVLMLTPLILILLAVVSNKSTHAAEKKEIKTQKIPGFIIGFILFSLIATFNLLPEPGIKILSAVSHYSLVIAMAGIGLKITFSNILRDGKPAFLMGSAVFLMQILFSCTAIHFLF